MHSIQQKNMFHVHLQVKSKYILKKTNIKTDLLLLIFAYKHIRNSLSNLCICTEEQFFFLF